MKAVDPDLTQEEALKMFQYDADTGVLYWRQWRSHPKCASRKSLRIAGSVFEGKYIRVTIKTKRVLAHRLIWLIVHGEWPKNLIDHRDGNGLNNRIENLRAASKMQNCRNRKPISDLSASGFRGVFRNTKKKEHHNQTKPWGAKIMVNWKIIHLGCFATKEEAFEARKKAEEKYYGEFACNGGDR